MYAPKRILLQDKKWSSLLKHVIHKYMAEYQAAISVYDSSMFVFSLVDPVLRTLGLSANPADSIFLFLLLESWPQPLNDRFTNYTTHIPHSDSRRNLPASMMLPCSIMSTVYKHICCYVYEFNNNTPPQNPWLQNLFCFRWKWYVCSQGSSLIDQLVNETASLAQN